MSIFLKSAINLALFLLVIKTAMAQPDKPPFKSAVKEETYSATLPEQEKELKKSILLKRFAESRKELSTDKYRPIYHFLSPESTMNDPNGLCYWQGNWHLFYQASPPEDQRQHWGHAYSADLIQWKDLPYAIYPGPERAVYSGTTLVEDDRVIAMYHGTEFGNIVAISDDPLLLNWTKLSEKQAAIPINDQSGLPLPYSVFDPSIWKKNGIYYSASAGKAPKGPSNYPFATAYLFRSKDLRNWQYVHEFIESDRFTLIGDDIACPYFWPIGNRYIMPFFSHMTGGQYFLGDYDKDSDKFSVTSHGRFNFGAYAPSGVHAPSASPDGDGGVIIIFNMNAGLPTSSWNQVMSLPRRLTLAGYDEVRQEPAGDIESLRYNPISVTDIKVPANKDILIEGVSGNAMELYLEIEADNSPAFFVDVLRSPNQEEYTRVSFFQERGYTAGRNYRMGSIIASPYFQPTEEPKAPTTTPNIQRRNKLSVISLETANSSLLATASPRPPETASLLLETDETIKLRIFIDKSIVEVFANEKQVLACRVYPSKDDATGISLRSQGKDAFVKVLKAWQMKSIYQ